MPRGKNYVNQNKGVRFQTSKKKPVSMELCFYGAGCARKDCIYRHETPSSSSSSSSSPAAKSNEPCMAYLAGQCSFTAAGCRKRHPNKAECEQLIQKYQTLPCRYGEHCKTIGCLFIHPQDQLENISCQETFPPLPSNPVAPIPNSSWRPAPPSSLHPWQRSNHKSLPMATAVTAEDKNIPSLNVNAKEFVPNAMS